MYGVNYYLGHPKMFIYGCLNRFSRVIPKKTYIKYTFWCFNNYFPNLKNPKTYNEKLQRIKLYDHNPIYPKLVDKYSVKKYIAKTIGEEYVIPTLGIRNNFDDINFNKLPNEFVLKCTHDSGSIVICKNKKKFNQKAAKEKLEKALNYNFYNIGKERAYKEIKPRIIAEKYMVDESGKELKDYKVFCFNGEPKIIQVDYDRFCNHKRNIYDLEWNLLPFEIKCPSDKNHKIKKPKCLDEMIKISRKLSKNFPHVRVDLYVINKKIYFGEMTFYHGSGFEEFRPKERGRTLGNWLELPKVKK